MRISDWSSDVCSSDLQRNWTVQKAGELAANVTQARRQFLETEFRYAFANDADIALAHSTSSSAPPQAALFHSQADADNEAEDRTSVVEGKSVSVRVDLGGRRIIKQKKIPQQ